MVTNVRNYTAEISRKTFTGVKVITRRGAMITYEHTNDLIGKMTGVFTRQLATGLEPDPETMKDFQKFTKKFLDELSEKVMEDQASLILDIKYELSQCHAYSAKKKRDYFNNSMKTLSRDKEWNQKVDKHFYEAMVKVGEKYNMSTEELRMFLTCTHAPGDRQRLIFVGKGEPSNGLLTMMMRPLIRSVKNKMPGFCHSVSCTQMAKDIQSNIDKLPEGKKVSLCADGSNHDGHQHWTIIKMIDVYFFKKIISLGWIEKALASYNYKKNCVLSVITLPLYEKISKLKVRFFNKKDKSTKRDKNIDLYIKGTTYSGSCSRTTFGNTIRVYLYWAYICHKLNLSVLRWSTDESADVFLYVSGDDSVLWTTEENAQLISANYLTWMSATKDKKEYGLGQCVTEFSMRAWDDIDFCSKISKTSPRGDLVILRHPKKILTGSNFHRYMSDTAFMPAYLHSEYVGESILHEMPGTLCRKYGEMRRDKGLEMKNSKKRKRNLTDYLKALSIRRKSYNI